MILLFVIAVLVIVTHLYKKCHGLPPGPWGIPFLGYLPRLDPEAPYETLAHLATKYGKVYGLSLGNVYTVVLTDPRTIRKVFAKDVTTGRAPLYLTHGIMQGYGLICAEGDLWKDQRRFVFDCLRQLGASKVSNQKSVMEKLIFDNACNFISHLKNFDNPHVFDPLDELRHSIGSIMNIIVFGKSWDRDDKTWIWLQHLQEEGTKHIGVAGPLNFLPIVRHIPKYKKTMKFLLDGKHKTHQVYQTIIEEQKLHLKKDEPFTNLIQAFLLQRLKKKNTSDLERFYCDEQFYHLLADVFGAGLDTTLTTLRWYLLYLAKNPELQQEIRFSIGTTSILEQLRSVPPLLEASISEAQRIRSVVPVGIPHGSLDDMEIDGYRVPKGTMIIPLQWAIHMDENIWTNPDQFEPKRFLNEDGKLLKHNSFMPFQMGKRMCVGDELARNILIIFGATIIQNFSIEVPEGEELDLVGVCGITLTPKFQKLVFRNI